MKVVFFTIISNSHYHGCRTNEFIESFKRFHDHPDIELIVFNQPSIDRAFAENPWLNFYNAKAYFAFEVMKMFCSEKIYEPSELKLIVNIDSDHLIFERLDSILDLNYDVACPANYNLFANASISINGKKLISEYDYFQGGLIASKSKNFWHQYLKASSSYSSIIVPYAENDVLNLVLAFSDYKIKYLDGAQCFAESEFKEYYGCASLGQENKAIIDNGRIKINGKPVKAYHFARGGIVKPKVSELFSKEVTDFIYSNIIKGMINIIKADCRVVDLSKSEKFVEHYNNPNTFAKFIIDQEINPGKWFDEVYLKLKDDAVVVDLGMNVGMYSVYINRPGRRFICAEPTAKFVQIAEELFKVTGVLANVHNCMIGNKDGESFLFVDESNSTMNRLCQNGAASTVSVPMLTLKSFFEANTLDKVDLLKMDIEGSEWQVIMEDETSADALKKCKYILLELHSGFYGAPDRNDSDIIEKIKSLGFIYRPAVKELAHLFINSFDSE